MIILRPWLFRLMRRPPRGMALWPFVLVKDEAAAADPYLLNHERIHHAQQIECLLLPFVIIYLLDFALMRIRHDYWTSYYALLHEREAFRHEHDLNYLATRRPFAWMRYLAEK